jgi:hypothetical protein
MRLDIFLRTCARGGIHSTPRVVLDDRLTLIKKCISSLYVAIANFKYDVKLYIIDDNSGPKFIDWLKLNAPCKYEIFEASNNLGFNASAAKQFDIAVNNSSDVLYLVEDDYFHSPQSLNIMFDTLKYFERVLPHQNPAVFPYDCVDRYQRDPIEDCKLFYNDGMYFRTVNKSSMTVMMHYVNFAKVYKTWQYLAWNFDPNGSCDEDSTINHHYRNGDIILFSPIPSLAVHIEYKQPTYISDLGVDYLPKHWYHYKPFPDL